MWFEILSWLTFGFAFLTLVLLVVGFLCCKSSAARKTCNVLTVLSAAVVILVGVHPSFTAHNDNSDQIMIILLDGVVTIAVAFLFIVSVIGIVKPYLLGGTE